MTRKLSQKFAEKSAARLAATQALFQMAARNMAPAETLKDFLTYRLGRNLEEEQIQPDSSLFIHLVEGSGRRLEEIDCLIKGNLNETWTIERLNPVLHAILRVGVFEILEPIGTDLPVIISEYVDVTRAFYNEREPAFVNGILDQIAKNALKEPLSSKAP